MMVKSALAIIIVSLVVALPHFVDDGAVYLLASIMVWAIACIGYDLVFGLTGLLCFGHAAFFGFGGYALAISVVSLGQPFLMGLVISAGAGATMALIFGYIALRTRGVYFALITLALAELVNIIVSVKLRDYTGGADGISGLMRPDGGNVFDFSSNANYASFIGVFFLAALALAALIRSSPFGQVLRAIRQNEVRAQQIGWSVNYYRLAILSISGAYAGVAGALLAGLMSFVGPDTIGWTTSGDLVIMTVLGGRDFLVGPILGVAAFQILHEVITSYTEHWLGALGIIFVACTLFMPNGVAGLILQTRRRSS